MNDDQATCNKQYISSKEDVSMAIYETDYVYICYNQEIEHGKFNPCAPLKKKTKFIWENNIKLVLDTV